MKTIFLALACAVAVSLQAQHFPFNQHNFFAAFQTGYYQALK